MGSAGDVGRPGAILILAAATAALAVGAGVAGTGAAAAQPATLTLHYTCEFPVILGQPVTVQINADVPASDTVDVPTQRFPIHAVATASDLLTTGLNVLGIHSVHGTANGNVHVAAPQGDLSVSIPFTIPDTTVPASGSFHVPVTGSAPSLTFTRPGHGQLTAGDIHLHLAAKNANGNPRGKLDLPCTLDNRQNNVIEAFDVKPQPAATATGTAGATPAATTRVTTPTTSEPARPGNGGAPAGGSTVADTAGRTAVRPTEPTSVTTAKPTKTSPTDGTFLNPTGGRASNANTSVLLTVGACAAAVAIAGYAGLLWRRRHANSEGILTVSQPEGAPEQERAMPEERARRTAGQALGVDRADQDPQPTARAHVLTRGSGRTPGTPGVRRPAPRREKGRRRAR